MTKIPLVRVEVWEFKKYCKEYEDANEKNKTEKHRIISEGSSGEYWNSPAFNFQLLKIPLTPKIGIRKKTALTSYKEMNRPVEGRRLHP